jgi:hypothetical protein
VTASCASSFWLAKDSKVVVIAAAASSAVANALMLLSGVDGERRHVGALFPTVEDVDVRVSELERAMEISKSSRT